MRALQTTSLFGLETNREFLVDVLANPVFAAGEATTAFIEEQFPNGVSATPATTRHALVAACLQYLEAVGESEHAMITPALELSGWSGTWNLATHFRYVGDDDQALDVHVRQPALDTYLISIGEDTHEVRWLSDGEEGSARLAIDNIQLDVNYCFLGRGEIGVQLGGKACVLTNELAFTKGDEGAEGSGTVTAPMHGNVLELMVAVGDAVEIGDDLAVMEAMKMEHRLTAAVAGEITAVHAVVGEQVAAGAVVLEIAEIEA